MLDLLLTEEEKLLRTTVREFAERELAPRAAELDEREEFPWESFRGLAALGLLGMGVDPAYGGSGGGYRHMTLVAEELARGCPGTCVGWQAHVSLGLQTIYRFGTESQKQRWLPSLAQGKGLSAFALTEPSAGSDAAALQLTATRRDSTYLLNGTKTFITNAAEADVLVVFATLDRSLGARGICIFVVERGAPGLSITVQKGKMGMRASPTAQLFFEDTPVPVENRLGEEGTGFRMAMQILDSSRIVVAGQCVGIAQACLEAALRYTSIRSAFGKTLAEHEAVQFMLADMATEVEAARLLAFQAAMLRDAGQPHTAEAAMAKLFASESAVRCAHKAVQLHGGSGYFRPMPVERLYRDAKAPEIYEGTSEVQRLVIARQLLRSAAGQR